MYYLLGKVFQNQSKIKHTIFLQKMYYGVGTDISPTLAFPSFSIPYCLHLTFILA